MFYSDDMTYFSLGVQDNVNYRVDFYPDLKLQIPGGYGDYRIGAISKLVELEHKPDLIRRAFSLATSSFIDVYFYPSKTQVYYGGQPDESKRTDFGFSDIFLSNSNANFFDRLYIYLFLNQKRQEQSSVITHLPVRQHRGEPEFSQDDFTKKYLGYFYQNTFRQEKKNIQILYGGNYINADRIGTMLEGNGIRVSDLTYKAQKDKGCTVVEQVSPHSATARAIATFFGCQLKQGFTDVYDILFLLGDREKDWEVAD